MNAALVVIGAMTLIIAWLGAGCGGEVAPPPCCIGPGDEVDDYGMAWVVCGEDGGRVWTSTICGRSE